MRRSFRMPGDILMASNGQGVLALDRYVWIVMGLNFVVDLLLLAAVFRLREAKIRLPRVICGAMLGGFYSGVCLLPDFHFLGNGPWRLTCLVLVSMLAFGMEAGSLRKAVLFCVLWLSLNGLAASFPRKNLWSWILFGALLLLLYLTGLDTGGKEYVPLIVRYEGKTARLTAFRDTGNFLKDPVTGKSVLVVDPVAALILLGLTQRQLLDPVQTLARTRIRGLRLIPYHTVGTGGGLLLAMTFPDVELDGQKAERIVAFAPQQIGAGRGFQALAGGMA